MSEGPSSSDSSNLTPAPGAPVVHGGAGGSDALRDRINRMGRGRGRGGAPSPWDSLVGLSGEEAAQRIRASDPILNVHVIPEGSMVTADHREDRVRVYVNREGNVSRTPRRG